MRFNVADVISLGYWLSWQSGRQLHGVCRIFGSAVSTIVSVNKEKRKKVDKRMQFYLISKIEMKWTHYYLSFYWGQAMHQNTLVDSLVHTSFHSYCTHDTNHCWAKNMVHIRTIDKQFPFDIQPNSSHTNSVACTSVCIRRQNSNISHQVIALAHRACYTLFLDKP